MVKSSSTVRFGEKIPRRRRFVTDQNVPSSREHELSSSLLLRVKGREQAAWDRLVHLYTPLVYSWCRRVGLQEADALDVGQEVFETVWRKIHHFRREQLKDSFRGWLRVITRHKVIDFYRRKQDEDLRGGDVLALAQQELCSKLPDPDLETDSAEATLIYHRAAALIQNEFDEKTWLAFRAVVMEGRTPTDSAAAFDMTVNAVYLAKARVLKRLRQEFEDVIDT
jgi:RNA polymerase sigma-70 factor, ECF subfamily